MASDVREGGRGLQEIGIIELGLPHNQPAVLQEGVVLLLGLLLHQLGIILPPRLLGGFSRDGVELDGLVALLDRTVERATCLLFVFGLRTNRIHVDHLRVVLFVSLLLAFQGFVEGLFAIEIDVIPGIERMIEAACLGVLFRATRPKQEQQTEDSNDAIPFFHSLFNGVTTAFIAFEIKNNSTKKRMMNAPEGTFR